MSESKRTNRMAVVARTDRLFAMPSILSGAARVLDLGDTFTEYNISRTPEEADMKALAADWGVISDDLWEAFHQLKERTPALAGD